MDSSFEKVLKHDVCVGCGMCAGIFAEEIEIEITDHGEYKAKLRQGIDPINTGRRAERICPFANNNENEDSLGKKLYGNIQGIQHSEKIGYYIDTHVAWVVNDHERIASSAGGITTWLLKYLLREKLVDGVVCVAPSNETGIHFEYTIIRQIDELDLGRKSKYYPIELSKVIREINRTDEKYAVVGIPCFLKGIRLAVKEGYLKEEQIYCTVGLFCGHLKTMQFADYLISCCGIQDNDNEVVEVDFRNKLRDQKASDYAFRVKYKDHLGKIAENSIQMKKVFMGNWGLNSFMLKACEYCDDVVAELADVSFGDAWLPEYVSDSRGTNIIVCRRNDLKEIFRIGQSAGEIIIQDLNHDQVVLSQDGGFRQRREALAYRLWKIKKKGLWAPDKRVVANRNRLKIYSKLIQLIRLQLARCSKEDYPLKGGKTRKATISYRVAFWVKAFNMLYKLRKKLFHLKRRLRTD